MLFATTDNIISKGYSYLISMVNRMRECTTTIVVESVGAAGSVRKACAEDIADFSGHCWQQNA